MSDRDIAIYKALRAARAPMADGGVAEYLRRTFGSSVSDSQVPRWQDGLDRIGQSYDTLAPELQVDGPTQNELPGNTVPQFREARAPDRTADQNRVLEIMNSGYRPDVFDRTDLAHIGIWPSDAELQSEPRNENLVTAARAYNQPLENWRRTYSQQIPNPGSAWWAYGRRFNDAAQNQMFRNHVYAKNTFEQGGAVDSYEGGEQYGPPVPTNVGPSYLEPGELSVQQQQPDTWADITGRYYDAAKRMFSGEVQPGQRATFLPLQATDTGAQLAVPGLAHDAAKAVQDTVDYGRAYQPSGSEINPSRETLVAPATDAVTYVAGAGSVAPKTGLGSFGGKLAQLPMDEASRMARAQEMGFKTREPLYHGTHAPPFEQFDLDKAGLINGSPTERAVWFSPNTEVASNFSYPNAKNAEGQRVIPTYVRGSEKVITSADLPHIRAYGAPQNLTYNQAEFARQLELARQQGYDSLRFKNVQEYGPASDQVAVFDPRNIRSVNAAFDPAKASSDNLLSANSDSTTPLALQVAREAARNERERK